MAQAVIRWEEVACPLCGAEDAAPVLTMPTSAWDRPLTHRQCRVCTLGYLNPRPARADLPLLFAQDFEAYQPTVVKPAAGTSWAWTFRRMQPGQRGNTTACRFTSVPCRIPK